MALLEFISICGAIVISFNSYSNDSGGRVILMSVIVHAGMCLVAELYSIEHSGSVAMSSFPCGSFCSFLLILACKCHF